VPYSGAVILLIDSDTRVPDDCFIDAVSEFEESPEVAIIQHSSGVMQVAHHFFENGIAHFTRGIQLSISFCCAGGTMGPFVGHNAFLRWSALQETMFEEDGVRKVWSESHVSEDFALSLALQLKGYIIRWATYSNDKFEEGVSLTCDDEVNRWQKYAWGCSELIFHPLRYWFTRGPFSPLFKQYLWSSIPLASKISNLGYIFSYYAIACTWPLTILNFVLIGFSSKSSVFDIYG
jgi:cellulose synthase/poly-beta-1,6-N-acetylglucosamine synthase-like glycosyltransferase